MSAPHHSPPDDRRRRARRRAGRPRRADARSTPSSSSPPTTRRASAHRVARPRAASGTCWRPTRTARGCRSTRDGEVVGSRWRSCARASGGCRCSASRSGCRARGSAGRCWTPRCATPRAAAAAIILSRPTRARCGATSAPGFALRPCVAAAGADQPLADPGRSAVARGRRRPRRRHDRRRLAPRPRRRARRRTSARCSRPAASCWSTTAAAGRSSATARRSIVAAFDDEAAHRPAVVLLRGRQARRVRARRLHLAGQRLGGRRSRSTWGCRSRPTARSSRAARPRAAGALPARAGRTCRPWSSLRARDPRRHPGAGARWSAAATSPSARGRAPDLRMPDPGGRGARVGPALRARPGAWIRVAVDGDGASSARSPSRRRRSRATTARRSPGLGHVSAVFVDPDHWRRGIARADARRRRGRDARRRPRPRPALDAGGLARRAALRGARLAPRRPPRHRSRRWA